MNQTLLPLIIAAVGVLGVCLAAWISATAALRVRLIDLQTANEAERKSIHIKLVSAVTELDGTLAHVIYNRTKEVTEKLHQSGNNPRAKYPPQQVEGSWNAPKQEIENVKNAVERWNEAQSAALPFVPQATGSILAEYDAQRSHVLMMLDAALTESNLRLILDRLKLAKTLCDAMQRRHAVGIFHRLEADKLLAEVEVFQTIRTLNISGHAKNTERRLTAQIKNIETKFEPRNNLQSGDKETAKTTIYQRVASLLRLRGRQSP